MTTSSGTTTITTPRDDRILMTRELAARPPLVYRAWTTPELVKRWWSGGHGTVAIADIDLRVGGTWRFVIAGDGGFEVAFHGEYREIVPDERLVYTETYEGAPADAEASEPPLDIVTFAPSDSGGTTLTLLVECHTKELRDLILDSGMEAGVQGQMDALEDVARSL